MYFAAIKTATAAAFIKTVQVPVRKSIRRTIAGTGCLAHQLVRVDGTMGIAAAPNTSAAAANRGFSIPARNAIDVLNAIHAFQRPTAVIAELT